MIQYANTSQLLDECYQDIVASRRIAVDIETTGLDSLTNSILLLQLYTGNDHPVWIIPVNRVDPLQLKTIVRTLADKICLIHNANFEFKFLRSHYGISLKHVYDSKVAESILTAGLDKYRTGLADVANRHLGITMDKEIRLEFVGSDPTTFEPTPEQLEYAAGDVLFLHQIRDIQLKELHAEGLLDVAELEFAAVPIFASMEMAGMVLDVAEHAEVLARYQERADRYGQQARHTLNPLWKLAETEQQIVALDAYTKHTGTINGLLEPLGGRLKKDSPEDTRLEVETLRKTRTKYKPKPDRDLSLTSRAMVLAALEKAGVILPDLKAETVKEYVTEYPLLASYAEWVKAQKVISTYGQNLVDKISPVTGRLHSEYNQIVSTGRTSSHGPNFQNIPPDIRACFKPRPGYKFVVADYSNQELRVAAILSNDPVMIKAFEEGIDLHKYTAAMAWPELYPSWDTVDKDGTHRSAAKSANFAVCYGGSPEVLVFRNLVDDLETAKRVVTTISHIYPTLWQWIHRVGEEALTTCYALTALGRKRYFEVLPARPQNEEEQRKWWKARSRIVRQAMNMPVQGTSADCMKRAMVMLADLLPSGAQIVAMVHDELVVEAHTDIASDVATLVSETMEKASAQIVPGLPVPAEVFIRDAWTKKG